MQDAETGFYYLQSRYYDPEIARFINADDFASTGQGILGYNMFAYCRNNPVNMFDHSGRLPQWLDNWLNDFKEWLKNEKEEASSNTNITLALGSTASGAFGVGASVSRGITIDTKGNVGCIRTVNGGGGFPNLGLGGFVSLNNAPTIYYQAGLGSAVGASGGPLCVAVGGDYNMMVDTVNGNTYHGCTITATYGLYPTIVEIHGEVGYTWVRGGNIYDVVIGFVEHMQQ